MKSENTLWKYFLLFCGGVEVEAFSKFEGDCNFSGKLGEYDVCGLAWLQQVPW